jgi:hypothetical protein
MLPARLPLSNFTSNMSRLSRNTRRSILLCSIGLYGCGRGKDYSAGPIARRPPLPEDAQLAAVKERILKKFSGVDGAEVNVGSLPGGKFKGVVFYREDTLSVFHSAGGYSHGGGSVSGISVDLIPEYVRVTWRDVATVESDDVRGGFLYIGNIIGEDRVEVGNAIPNQVIQSILRGGGGLRLKFRMAPEGTYFGWDIARFYKRGWTTPSGMLVNPSIPRYEEAGGNVCEAMFLPDGALVKGWYIHKKTGFRMEIETPD